MNTIATQRRQSPLKSQGALGVSGPPRLLCTTASTMNRFAARQERPIHREIDHPAGEGGWGKIGAFANVRGTAHASRTIFLSDFSRR